MRDHDHAQQQDQPSGPLPGARPGRDREGRDRPRRHRGYRRARTWLAWWVLMMSLWVAVDDSLQPDELLAGAGAAALAALAGVAVTGQAGLRFPVKSRWLLEAARLPWEVARDTCVVFTALARLLLRHEPPASEFTELPLPPAQDPQDPQDPQGPEGETRTVLLTWAKSLAPNTFVLGTDAERHVMIVHRLVPNRGSGT